MIQLELETPLGKAEQTILCVAFFFKGMTLNKKMRLDYELLRFPETSIFKWSGYISRSIHMNTTIRLIIIDLLLSFIRKLLGSC